MIRMVFIFIFFSLILFGQEDINKIECRIKSLKTTCVGNPKEVISEIKYKAYNSSYSYAKIDRIFGRFEDLKHGLYTTNFQENRIDFTCNETIRHDQQNEVFYAQESDDLRKFYFIYSNYMLIYKGTEEIKQIKKINLNDPKKYLLLYNKEQENNHDYEVTYNYTNSLGTLSYSFHQRGNEFDEYTYEYEKRSGNYTTYKNESLLEQYSYSYGNEEKMDDVNEMIIRQYVIPESYQLDKKNNPVLKTSKFSQKNMCSCEEGYITKIELWSWNKCRSKYVLEQ